MKIVKISKENPEQKMQDWFEKRTNKHIGLVGKYCKKIVKYDKDKYNELLERLQSHDQSKFKDPEVKPYVYITWKYKCKADNVDWEPPEKMDEKMDVATEHHILHNRHHPEFHCGRKTNLINTKDRDKPPSQIVNATKMLPVDLAEMVADWCAVSEEKSSNPKTWADNWINVRWKFTDNQKEIIYELIDEIWNQ